MLRRALRRAKAVYVIYLDEQVPRAAAAMSYYLTMSLFPLIVCLYALLGRNYESMLRILELADRVVSPETTRYVKGFLIYVANHSGSGMLLAAVTLLLSSASAGVRVMQLELREIRGRQSSWLGVKGWLFSLVFSLGFVAVLYFGILVMLTGPTVLAFVEKILPMLPITKSWDWLRFFVLGGLVFLTLWGVYAVSALHGGEKGHTAPGALLGTLLFEGTGAVILTVRFCFDFPFSQALARGVFHAVSAFCNAGFDLFGGGRSLTGFSADGLMCVTAILLVVIGGLGFGVDRLVGGGL